MLSNMAATMNNNNREGYNNFVIPVQLDKNEDLPILQAVLIKTLPNESICFVDDDQFLPKPISNDYSEIPMKLDLIQEPQIKNIKTILLPPPNHQPESTNKQPNKLRTKKNDVVIKCIKCNNEFNNLTQYRKHMAWHQNTRRFKCTKCSVSYNAESNLKVHMAIHAEGKPTCPMCNISFQRMASLKSHLLIHQVEETYVCESCKAEFEKEEELMKHLELHATSVLYDNIPLICVYCKVEFDDQTAFKEHVSHHIKVKKLLNKGKKTKKKTTKDGKYVCEICKKGFIKYSLLERHERVHTGVKPYVCQICNRGFSQRGTLQIHLKKHEGIKPYECTLCPAKFAQKGNLKVHIEKIHTASSADEKRYKCFHCSCIFKKVASLNGHMTKVHTTNANSFSVDTVINNLKELEMQSNNHERESAMQKLRSDNINKEKNQDDFGYLTSNDLVKVSVSGQQGNLRKFLVRQRKIGDIRYYFCSYCSKKFKKPSDLIRHIRIHTKEKPFKCKFCNTSFSLKSTLFCHLKRHVAKKDYICPICQGTFINLRSLHFHIKKHTPENIIYECKQCHLILPSFEEADIHSQLSDGVNSNHNVLPAIKNLSVITNNHQQRVFKPPVNDEDSNRKYQCSICKSKFVKLVSLKRHMLCHSTDRKYKCDVCPKSFLTSYRLKEHTNYHTNVRNFQCKTCHKRYVTANLLKRHQLVHMTQRPFTCWYCDKKFKTPLIRKQHLKRVHNLEDTPPTSVVKLNDNISTVLDLTDLANEEISLIQKNSNQISVIASNLSSEVCKEDTMLQTSTNTQEVFEIPTSALQILSENTNNLISGQDNGFETIYINSDGIQLSSNTNLYSQLKIENSDCLMLNDGKILFNPEHLNTDICYETSEIINVNQFFNTSEQSTTHAPDTLSTQVEEKQEDAYNKSDISLNSLLTTNKISNDLYPNITFGNELESNDNTQISNVLDNNSTIVDSNPIFETDDISSNDIFENTNYICTKCSKFFINLEQFKKHICYNADLDNNNTGDISNTQNEEATKNDSDLQCPECNKTFLVKHGLKKHMECHRKGQKPPTLKACTFCPKSFKKNIDLQRHIRTHTGERPFACDKCDKKFALKSTLLSHSRSHDPQAVKQFNCSVCNAFLTSKSTLKLHMYIHTGKKPYSCSYCQNKYRSATAKKAHEINKHKHKQKDNKSEPNITSLLASVANDITPIDQGTLTLVNPQETLSEDLAPDLAEQLQINSSDILQQLQTSNIIIQDQAVLDNLPSVIRLENLTLVNFKTIPEEKIENVSYQIEPIASTSTSVLTVNEKPRNLKCDICFKKYASKDVLRKHKKIHGLNKQFLCKKCKKGFDTQEEFDKHSKLHMGYRPHSCKYCNNSFGDVKGLNAHIKRIHGNADKYLIL